MIFSNVVCIVLSGKIKKSSSENVKYIYTRDLGYIDLHITLVDLLLMFVLVDMP